MDHFFDIAKRLKELDGQLLGEGFQDSKIRLSKNDKGAWIKHMADQYSRKEEMDVPPEELKITRDDVIKELIKRKLRRVFDN